MLKCGTEWTYFSFRYRKKRLHFRNMNLNVGSNFYSLSLPKNNFLPDILTDAKSIKPAPVIESNSAFQWLSNHFHSLWWISRIYKFSIGFKMVIWKFGSFLKWSLSQTTKETFKWFNHVLDHRWVKFGKYMWRSRLSYLKFQLDLPFHAAVQDVVMPWLKDHWDPTKEYIEVHWLVSNFMPTDSKKFEFQNFKWTIRLFIKNKLELKKIRSRDRRIFEKNQFTISKL